MKNALNYYYNLNPETIHQSNKQIKFTINNENYILTPYERDQNDINNLYEISTQLFQRQIYCHQFVLNTSNSIITLINGIPYILLKVYVDSNDKIIINDIIYFLNNSISSTDNTLSRNNWGKLWSDKIDYFEYQVNQFGKRYPIIRESFSYYVGLAETGIMLYKNAHTKTSENLIVCHKRIKKDYTIYDLYNPLNFIVDLKIRDAAEFFKERFFESPDLLDEIKYYINHANLTSYECIMFFVRILYPSFYFDIYEKIMDDKESEEALTKVINKTNEYEVFLKELYQYLRTMINIPDIEWLKKT